MVLRPEDFPVLLENANGSRPLFKVLKLIKKFNMANRVVPRVQFFIVLSWSPDQFPSGDNELGCNKIQRSCLRDLRLVVLVLL